MTLSFDNVKKGENKVKITFDKYIENTPLNPNDCYVIDLESYNHNANIRMIQLYDVGNKCVDIYLDGKTVSINKIGDIKVNINSFDNEKEMLKSFLKKLKDNPKILLGHNLAHFDLGLIQARKSVYNLSGLRFWSYGVSGLNGQHNVFFSYEDTDITNKIKDKRLKFEYRIPIVDTLQIARTLQLKFKSLKALSEISGTKYEKKDVDHKVWYERIISKDDLLYGIYDVLSVPDILLYLQKIYVPLADKYMTIHKRASQLILEHDFMKSSGQVVESFFEKLFDGNIDHSVPDFLSKYFGGYTRAVDVGVHLSDDNQQIRYLDFTSCYPFSIKEQNLFDILNGDFVYLRDVPIKNGNYKKIIYSSIIEVKAKEDCKLIQEVELHKEKNQMGIGFFRNFENDIRVQDTQSNLAVSILRRGKKTYLTKGEVEITKSILGENNFSKLFISRIVDGLYATNNEKTNKYIGLYGLRKQLKDNNDPAEQGIKLILNSSYGKLAESKGRWFNNAIASATTSYARVQIQKALSKAKELEINVLYCDTDGMYVKGNSNKIKKLISYGNTLNEHPKKLFKTDNLKDEGENIICFWAIKRKRYVKIFYDKNNKIKIKIAGQNGNSDLGFRDALLRLWFLVGGTDHIDKLKRKIEKREFDINFCKELEQKYNKLNEKLDNTKTSLRLIRVGDTKTKNWNEFYDLIKPIIFSDEYGEWLSDSYEAKRKGYYFKKLSEYLNITYIPDSSNTYLYLFEKLKSDYSDETLIINLLNKIGKCNIYMNKEQTIIDLEQQLIDVRYDLKNLTNSYELLIKNVYENYRGKNLSDIIPSMWGNITRLLNVHLKNKVNYKEDIFYNKLIKKWGIETKGKPYTGLFFFIQRDLSSGNVFSEPDTNNVSWAYDFTTFFSKKDRIPMFNASDYYDLINRDIKIDTIKIKSREPLSLLEINSFKQKAFSQSIYNWGHSGKTRTNDINNSVVHFRLQIEPDGKDGIKSIKILNKAEEQRQIQKHKKENQNVKGVKTNKYIKVYANANMFISPQVRFETSIRLNKLNLFVNKRSALNVYRFLNYFSRYMERWILEKFNKTHYLMGGSNVSIEGVSFKSIPRITFCSQIDVCQPTTKEHHKKMFMIGYDSGFSLQVQNNYIQYDILKYLSISCYDKKNSAEYKLNPVNYKLLKSERILFENEAKEGFRSEFKLKLKRNFYEALSYAFLLDSVNHESIVNILTADHTQKFSKKGSTDLYLTSRYKGFITFNRNKCVLLFEVSTIIYECKEYELGLAKNTPLLEGTWVLNTSKNTANQKSNRIFVKYAPPEYENNNVKWRFEIDEIISKYKRIDDYISGEMSF